MRLNYAKEKLSKAVYELATGEHDVRSRLWSAYLLFHPLQLNNFPIELQNDWELILL